MLQIKTSGFTIIEVLVAIVITGIIALGITGLFMSTERTQQSSSKTESATRAGEQQVESLRNNSYATLVPGSTINFTSELPNDLPVPRSGTVAVSEPVDGLRRVDVTITYTDRGKTKKVMLSSLIGQIGIGQ